jgi:hypothetical protein
MKIDNFPDRFARAPDERSPRPQLGDIATLVYLPEFVSGWTRRYRAVENVGDIASRYWRSSIEADGLINQISIIANTSRGANNIFVGWYAGVVLQGMIVAEWFRRWVGRPDVEYVLDGEFINAGSQVKSEGHFDTLAPINWLRASLGPLFGGEPYCF